MVLVVQNPPAAAGDIRNAGSIPSIPGSGRFPEGMAAHSSILAWRIPGMVGCRLWGHTKSDTTEAT